MYISKFVKFILIMKSTKWKGLEMPGLDERLGVWSSIRGVRSVVRFWAIFSTTLCGVV